MASPAPDRAQQHGDGIADPGKGWRSAHGVPVVPAFDGFRGLAIVCVVMFHLLYVSGTLSALGDSNLAALVWGSFPHSVDALFVVSGFVLYLPTAARNGEFGRVSSFMIRRAARLFPAYWLCLVVAIVLLATVPSRLGDLPGLGPILAHFAVLQTPALLVEGDFPLGLGVVPPVWTLSVEVGFYLVLPLVAGAYLRHPLVGLVAAAAIVVGWSLVAGNFGQVSEWLGVGASTASQDRIDVYYASQFPNWAFALAAGMTGAWAYVHLGRRIPAAVLDAWSLRIAAAATVLLLGFVLLAGRDAIDSGTGPGLFGRQPVLVGLGYQATLAAAMVAVALTPAAFQRPVTNTPMRKLGDISYGIYLIHFAVIWVAISQFSLPSDGTLAALAVWALLVYPASIGYAYLSARFLEQPVRRWARRFGRRSQAAAAASTGTPDTAG